MKKALLFVVIASLTSATWAQAPRPVLVDDVTIERWGSLDSRADTMVYLNFAGSIPPEQYYIPFYEAGAAYGDDLHLVQGGFLSKIAYAYYDPDGGTALSEVTVSIYENDANNTNFPGGDPSPALIGSFTITGLPGDGLHLLTYDEMTPLELPEHIWMEFDFSNSSEAGLVLYNPPTVGSSQDLFYVHGVDRYVLGHPYVANFGLGLWIGDEPSCPGDLNGDGQRNLDDLAEMLSNYGITSGATPEQGDMNGDGAVNLDDLAGLLAVYGQPCE